MSSSGKTEAPTTSTTTLFRGTIETSFGIDSDQLSRREVETFALEFNAQAAKAFCDAANASLLHKSGTLPRTTFAQEFEFAVDGGTIHLTIKVSVDNGLRLQKVLEGMTVVVSNVENMAGKIEEKIREGRRLAATMAANIAKMSGLFHEVPVTVPPFSSYVDGMFVSGSGHGRYGADLTNFVRVVSGEVNQLRMPEVPFRLPAGYVPPCTGDQNWNSDRSQEWWPLNSEMLPCTDDLAKPPLYFTLGFGDETLLHGDDIIVSPEGNPPKDA